MTMIATPSMTTPMPDPAALEPRTPDRSGQIRAGLITAILEQRLLPGTKLGEDEIGAIYGASRTLVRAALQLLAHEGIVVIEKNRGAFVASPSPAEAREVFEARRLIEAEIAGRAIAAISAAGLARLDLHLEAERAAEATGDRHAAIRLSGEFHLLLADMAGHSVYASILRKLVARSSLILLLYRSRNARTCGAAHHAAITAAIRAGRIAEARQLMADHLVEIEAGLDLSTPPGPDTGLADILRPAR